MSQTIQFYDQDGEPDGTATRNGDEIEYSDEGVRGIMWASVAAKGADWAWKRFSKWSNGYASSKLVDEPVEAAAGHDITPGHDELHHYWVAGPGLARWAESPTPWTTLVANLVKVGVNPEKAKVYASRWFIEHFGFSAGSDLNRVTHGRPPRGDVVGPG